MARVGKIRWSVYKIKGAKRTMLGLVWTDKDDKKAALKEAYREYNIREAERFRISVERD